MARLLNVKKSKPKDKKVPLKARAASPVEPSAGNKPPAGPSTKPSSRETFSQPQSNQPREQPTQQRPSYQQAPKQITPPVETVAYPRKPFTKEKVAVDNYQLPASYNTTSITLLPRDPHWIHAYWEVAPSSIDNVRNQIGGDVLKNSALALRMYDVTYKDFNGANANRTFDIDVGFHANNWYISLWNDNATYCCDVGVRTPDGRFFGLARSNFATTARAGSSNRSDMIWMEVKDQEQQQQPYVFVEIEKAKTGGTRGTASQRPYKIFLTEDDIRAYYSRLFPLLRKVLAERLARQRRFAGQRLKIYLKDGQILLDELLIRGLSRSQFLKRILLGSSAEMVLVGGASESAASEREAKKRKFFFEIGTELIVYGSTEPDAEVWLGNKKIKLRNDGTFTLRFALPEGVVPLDFTANSHDKQETREISTSVERTKTKYKP